MDNCRVCNWNQKSSPELCWPRVNACTALLPTLHTATCSNATCRFVECAIVFAFNNFHFSVSTFLFGERSPLSSLVCWYEKGLISAFNAISDSLIWSCAMWVCAVLTRCPCHVTLSVIGRQNELWIQVVVDGKSCCRLNQLKSKWTNTQWSIEFSVVVSTHHHWVQLCDRRCWQTVDVEWRRMTSSWVENRTRQLWQHFKCPESYCISYKSYNRNRTRKN